MEYLDLLNSVILLIMVIVSYRTSKKVRNIQTCDYIDGAEFYRIANMVRDEISHNEDILKKFEDDLIGIYDILKKDPLYPNKVWAESNGLEVTTYEVLMRDIKQFNKDVDNESN